MPATPVRQAYMGSGRKGRKRRGRFNMTMQTGRKQRP